MKKLALIYHSAHGHTEHVAEEARSMPDTDVYLIKAETLTSSPNSFLEFDGFLLGSSSYGAWRYTD